jgi:CobQ-like glutamine amidotransferase family enzyme
MKHTLKIGWLYPDLMSTYGDRGNILVLRKRLEWRGMEGNILPITVDTTSHELRAIDLLFGGGAQDREQEIVMRDLKKAKGDYIKTLIEDGVPALFVCGAPQLMGKFYEPAVGERIEGLGIFDMETRNPGPGVPRLIGNIVAEVEWQDLDYSHPELVSGSHTQTKGMLNQVQHDDIIVGFENHGGRTFLGKNSKPFARVIKGHGNNGEDGTEGVVYKNAIGCYFHGPLLPKNPAIADWLLKTALEKKYKEPVALPYIDDALAEKAREAVMQKLGVSSR